MPTPAEIYEERFVPALFGPWGGVLAEVARIAPGERVLDVACGTGVAAIVAQERVGRDGHVAGLDPNPDMLTVARCKSDAIAWHEGRAEVLPFDDASFDAVISQFGLMFFEDRPAALREMMRVLRSGGRLAVAVWDELPRAPGYAVLAALLERLFGRPIAEAFRAPFVLGDVRALLALCDEARIDGVAVHRHVGRVRFSSIDALLATERACVMTLGGLLDDEQFERLLAKADPALRSFVAADGSVQFDIGALMLSASRA